VARDSQFSRRGNGAIGRSRPGGSGEPLKCKRKGDESARLRSFDSREITRIHSGLHNSRMSDFQEHCIRKLYCELKIEKSKT